MSPLYCLLFVFGFLCSLQTISADEDVDADEDFGPLLIAPNPIQSLGVPGGYTPVDPKSQDVLNAFVPLKNQIRARIDQQYPNQYPGFISVPLAAKQQLVANALHYQITFAVLNINSIMHSGIQPDSNFTANIFLNNNAGGNTYKLSDVVHDTPKDNYSLFIFPGDLGLSQFKN